VPAAEACPTSDLSSPRLERMTPATSGPLGPGAFTTTYVSERPVPHGRWRVCVAMSSSPSSDDGAAASATATIETGFRPKYSIDDRPRIARARRGVLRCDRGAWIALPRAIRFSVDWLRNGKRIAGARSWRLRTHRYGDYQCRVTARNRFGVTRVRSPKEQLRPYIGG
jgi:hypothetical protein